MSQKKKNNSEDSILRPFQCPDFGISGEGITFSYLTNFVDDTFSFFKVSLRGIAVSKKQKKTSFFSRKPGFSCKCFYYESYATSPELQKKPEPQTDLLSGLTMKPFPPLPASSSTSTPDLQDFFFPLPPRLPCSYFDKENAIELFYMLEFEGTPKDQKHQNKANLGWDRIFWKKKIVILNRSLTTTPGGLLSSGANFNQKKTSSKASKMGHSIIEHVEKGVKDQFSTKGVHIELVVDQPNNNWGFGEEILVRTFIDNESELVITSLSVSVVQLILINSAEVNSSLGPSSSVPRLSSFRTISFRQGQNMPSTFGSDSSPKTVNFDQNEKVDESSSFGTNSVTQKKVTPIVTTVCDSSEKFPVQPSTTSTGVAILKLPPFDPSSLAPTIRHTPFFKVEYIIQGTVSFSEKRAISPIVRLPILLCSITGNSAEQEIFSSSKYLLDNTGDLSPALSLKNISHIPLDLHYPPDQTYLRQLTLS